MLALLMEEKGLSIKMGGGSWRVKGPNLELGKGAQQQLQFTNM
jgi:hypothetical protein